jgi:LPXTG-motif cell wall-anchored protein
MLASVSAQPFYVESSWSFATDYDQCAQYDADDIAVSNTFGGACIPYPDDVESSSMSCNETQCTMTIFQNSDCTGEHQEHVVDLTPPGTSCTACDAHSTIDRCMHTKVVSTLSEALEGGYPPFQVLFVDCSKPMFQTTFQGRCLQGMMFPDHVPAASKSGATQCHNTQLPNGTQEIRQIFPAFNRTCSGPNGPSFAPEIVFGQHALQCGHQSNPAFRFGSAFSGFVTCDKDAVIASLKPPATGPSSSMSWVIGLACTGVVAIAGAGALVFRRRRRQQQQQQQQQNQNNEEPLLKDTDAADS